MSHWIITPVVLPAMMAALMVLGCRHHRRLQRIFALAGAVVLVAIAGGMFWQASDGTITIYQLGNWQAPFGIVLVADRLSTMMVLLTSVLSGLVLLYAVGTGWDQRGRHFHALFQFQIMGIMGAFLTGDAFNLFVFFEVLLIASYGLLLHSGGTERFRSGLQYMLYNLLGSTLFLFALGTLYAEAGTLNMADLAARLAASELEHTAGLRVASVLLLLVFAVKAALLPLHFWLPASYAAAPGPVAALFAVMTKVGAYAIIRFYTLVFPPSLEMTQGLFDTWLLPAALMTLALGMIGVLGSRRLDKTVAFAVIGSMGMLLASVAVFTPAGIAAALYYALHSTFATAALFLIVDIVRERRGAVGTRLQAAPTFAGGALIAGMFFVAAIAMAGLPPLSGFLGKLMILEAATAGPLVWWVWGVVLGSSLIAVVGFANAGSIVFWKSHQVDEAHAATAKDPEDSQGADEPHDPPFRAPALPAVAIGGLITMLVALTVLAGPVTRFLNATTAQLFDPAPYIATVLDTPGKQISYTPKDKAATGDGAGQGGDHAGAHVAAEDHKTRTDHSRKESH